jgi:phosphotransferase system enzyme I (PtsI)
MVADSLAAHLDFFSIGTNDLIQYALAIDRVNEHVAYMYDPYHPAVIRLIMQTVKAAKDNGIEVALCGEMAGDPLCTALLLGTGIDELSMNTGAIPLLKKLIRSLSYEESVDNLNQILRLATSKEVREFIVKKTETLLPEIGVEGLSLNMAMSNS